MHNRSTATKGVAVKGSKQVCQMTSGERGTLLTACCFISGSGNTLPPALIFPRKIFKPFMTSTSLSGTLGLAHPSGWMTKELFVEVMAHFIKWTQSSKDNPNLLIYDNHESHLSMPVIEMARESGVTILTLPPHCSHKLQPLDVGVFGPFKNYYSSEADKWLRLHPGKKYKFRFSLYANSNYIFI